MNLFFTVLLLSAAVFLLLVARAKPAYTFALASLVFLVSFFPFIWGISISFFDFSPPNIQFVGLKNLSFAATDPGLALSVKITAIWALSVLVMKLIISYALALSIASMKKLAKFLYMLILTPWAIPAYISIVSWTSLVEGYGGNSIFSRFLGMNFDLTTNAPAAFFWTAFVSAWLGIPLMTMVILSALQTISPQLKDLAKMEGMDPIEKALNLYIPHTLPIVFPYIFLTFLGSFKEFTTIFLMTSGGPSMVSGFGQKSIVGATTLIGMFVYDKFYSTNNYGVLGAYSTVVGIIMLALLAIGWNYRRSRKKFRIIAFTLVVHVFFDLWGMGSGLFSFVPISFYVAALLSYLMKSSKFKKIFVIGALLDAVYMFVGVSFHGVNAVSLSSVISIVVALTLAFEGQIHINVFKFPNSVWKFIKAMWLSFWSILVLLPLWNIIIMGFSKENLIPMSLIPHSLTFSNFFALFENYGFFNAIKNSLVIAAIAVIITLLTVFPAAWAGVDHKKASNFGNVLVFAALFTGMHTLIPLVITFKFLNLLNTLEGVAISVAIHSAAITYFLIYPFLLALPKSLNEAAKIDGASGFVRMTRIYLPLALPSLITVGVLVFVESWNSFVLPLVLLNSQNLYPVSIMLYNFIGEYGTSYSIWNLFGAGSIFNLVIIGILFYIARKNIVSGVISRGGV